MLKLFVIGISLAAGLAQAPAHLRQNAASAAQADTAPSKPNDYADGKTWLCRPGRQDACAIDHSTTVVAADGKLSKETWTADSNAPIDCFYVYPTISTDPTPNSDMNADPAELNVIKQQFARFASKCKPYAPLYRQVTLVGLRRTATQTGCVITFASFRSTVPPPANTLFGRVPDAAMSAACTNPAALAGGSGELRAYLDKTGRTITSNTPGKPWVTPEQPIETPWVSVPGLLTATCASNDNASGYLEVTVHAIELLRPEHEPLHLRAPDALESNRESASR